MFTRREILSGGSVAAAGGFVTLAASQPADAAPTDQIPAVQSAGPFNTDGGEDHILIGLLIPAVQKPREPFRFVLVACDGSVLVARALVPAVQRAQSPFIASFFDIFVLGDGSVRVVDRNSKETLYEGTPAGGGVIAVLIGLLDQAGKTHGAVGGSVQFLGGVRDGAAPPQHPALHRAEPVGTRLAPKRRGG